MTRTAIPGFAHNPQNLGVTRYFRMKRNALPVALFAVVYLAAAALVIAPRSVVEAFNAAPHLQAVSAITP